MIRFLAYLAASALALGVDYLAYLAFAVWLSVPLAIAAVMGYAVGLVVAYFLIAYRVMNDGWLRTRRHYEGLLFLASGVLGMAVTYVFATSMVKFLGDSVHWVKIGAAGASFFSVYFFRRFVVFRISV